MRVTLATDTELGVALCRSTFSDAGNDNRVNALRAYHVRYPRSNVVKKKKIEGQIRPRLNLVAKAMTGASPVALIILSGWVAPHASPISCGATANSAHPRVIRVG